MPFPYVPNFLLPDHHLGSAKPKLPTGHTNRIRNTSMKNKMAQSLLKHPPKNPPLSAIQEHLLNLLVQIRISFCFIANIIIFFGLIIGYKMMMCKGE